MYTALLQLLDTIHRMGIHYFLIFFGFVWLVYVFKWIVSRFYKPYAEPYETSVSVVIPVVDEDPELFRRVLRATVTAGAREIWVVINGPKQEALEEVCWQEQLRVRRMLNMDLFAGEGEPRDVLQFTWTPRPGKRNAILEGASHCRGDIIVLLDSDTIMEPDTLHELMKPFADSRVGGVTTHQNIYDRRRSILTRFADWMEDIRTAVSMPAMSVFGQVGCLPGRCIAFRREILTASGTRRRFLHREFLGLNQQISDDRVLTNYTLREGFRTFYQRTARVTTDAPTSWRKYWKQQLRWARGSQYNTLRMTGFMFRRKRFLAFVFWTDIIVPFWLVGTLVNIAWKVYREDPIRYSVPFWWVQVLLVAMGILTSAFLRNLGHLRRFREDLVFLPAYVLLLSLMMTPIRVLGFFIMARDAGWGTRVGAHGTSFRRWRITSWVPTLLGIVMLATFSLAGPFLETPNQLRQFMAAHGVVVGLVALGIFVLFEVPPLWQRLWRRMTRRWRRNGATELLPPDGFEESPDERPTF